MTKKTRTDTNLDDDLNDILSNHSFHSDRTANTSTSCSSLDVTSPGTRTAASSNISEYIPRRPYPNPAPAGGDQQPTSASSDVGAPTSVSTEKVTPDEIIIDNTSATATTAANERPQIPRRSSLKKTSNYEIKLSENLSAQNMTNGPTAQETETAQRRWSATDISSTTRPESEMTTNQPNPQRRRRSVQFDKTVSFSIVPTAADILEEHEEGGGAKDLFYTEKEFLRMKRNIKRDAQKIFKSTASMEENENNNTCAEQNSQKEDELCDWGIEFHTSSRADRLDRAIRLQDVIQTVLQEQDSQCIDPSTGMLTEASVEYLAKASQKSRRQAQRRGSEAERHCRRWSSDFGVVDASSAPTTVNGSEFRRHSSYEHGEEFDNVVAAVYEDNDATCGDEVLSVADASLDESTPRVRPRLRRRASSCA